ncbi:hypothetical protein F889_00062 [Acinetobacter colistiniresistens]|uniref:Undecaprenyl/decaprenyl-phosphate alpha-N-acetylglucosaminyl 1-phosphate transferase n=1 Tax=Acinetobacter colistiniresistens TaxID=280145 RepID=N9R394_9GAMM|nr:MraY family glycosyltransferase [Acinetobacter colistiniresistens]ENX36811.1 hypothetical protein F889_00062 [Acinetobacter colistiniresistens]
MKILIFSILCGWFLTWCMRKIARKLGFMAKPNPLNPSHIYPVAYMGGVAVSFTIIIFYFLYTTEWDLFWVVGLLGFLLVGIWDDLYTPKPLLKFLIQSICALITAFSYGVWLTNIPSVLQIGFTAFILLFSVNAVNLTDVSDGLVASLGIIICLALSLLLPHSIEVISISCTGALIGFLFWNKAPASIYLGDAGSHVIGATIALLCLEAYKNTPTINTAISLILFVSIFIFELFLLFIVRYKKNIPFWQGSPDHFALRLQAAGFSRQQTAILAALANIYVVTLGLLNIKYPQCLWLWLWLYVIVAYYSLHFLLKWNVTLPTNKKL